MTDKEAEATWFKIIDTADRVDDMIADYFMGKRKRGSHDFLDSMVAHSLNTMSKEIEKIKVYFQHEKFNRISESKPKDVESGNKSETNNID